MKGLRNIPRVLKINRIEGRKLSLLFNNGESRIVDIADLFASSQSGIEELERQIIENNAVFTSVEVTGTTISWPGVGMYSTDDKGDSVFYPYDIDPIVLYQAGIPDKENTIDLGGKIKRIRKESGLTQEELARRSGTSKHYISRLENNKSDIEFMTLKKIVEAGLNKKLRVEIS
jgi:DNA-binding XRE family transcriptional regulator